MCVHYLISPSSAGIYSGSVKSKGDVFLLNASTGEFIDDSDGPCDRGPAEVVDQQLMTRDLLISGEL